MSPEGGNHQTYYTYNVLNQLTQVQMPRGGVTQYRTFNYNLTTGRLTSATNPENGTVSYTYNPDGTPLRKTDARGAIEFSYDQYQRVTQKHVYTWSPNNEDPCAHVDFYYDTNPLETNWPSAWGHLTAMRWGGAKARATSSPKLQVPVRPHHLQAPPRPALTAGNYTTSADNLDASFSYGNEGQLAYIHYPTWYNLQGTPGQNLTLSYTFDTLGRPLRATGRTAPVGQRRHLRARWRAHRGHLRGNARSVRLHLLQRNPHLQRARPVDAADRGKPRRPGVPPRPPTTTAASRRRRTG